MKNLNYLMDHIFCIRYSRLFEYILKKHGEKTHNSSIRIYVNKIHNRITFKIKTGYYLELSSPETMKLLGSTKSEIDKDENDKDVPHLEINEAVLVILLTKIINKIQDSYINLFLINHLVKYWIFHSKVLFFKKLLIQNFHILKYGLLIKVLNC